MGGKKLIFLEVHCLLPLKKYSNYPTYFFPISNLFHHLLSGHKCTLTVNIFSFFLYSPISLSNHPSPFVPPSLSPYQVQTLISLSPMMPKQVAATSTLTYL